MWGSKEPGTSRTAEPEPKNLQSEPAVRASSDDGGGNDQVGKEARLGPSLQMKGEIIGGEDLVIDGLFEGIVQLDDRRLTVGTTGRVTADISAGEVVVRGKVKGNVRARNCIEIKKDASVTGDLTTAQILIEDGAYYKGSINIERSAMRETPKNVFSQAGPTSTPPKAAAAGTNSI